MIFATFVPESVAALTTAGQTLCGSVASYRKTTMLKHLQNWGALYILGVMFLGSLAGQYLFQVRLAGEDLNQFGSAVFENWQSEWLQLFVQA